MKAPSNHFAFLANYIHWKGNVDVLGAVSLSYYNYAYKLSLGSNVEKRKHHTETLKKLD